MWKAILYTYEKRDDAEYECLRKGHEQNKRNTRRKWPFNFDITTSGGTVLTGKSY